MSPFFDNSFVFFFGNIQIILISIIYIIFINKILNNKLPSYTFWPISILYLILCRSNDFNHPLSMNPDEEQWLIIANSIIDSPSIWLNKFALFDFTRFFTFIPLLIFSFFTNYLTYDHARLINIILYIIFLIIQYKLLKIKFNKNTSILLVSIYIIFFSTSNHFDLVQYNSEMPCIVFISLSILQFYKDVKLKLNSFYIFLNGLTVAMIVFSKEQAIPIAGFIGIFITIYYLLKKNYLKSLLFSIGGVSGILLFMIPLLNIYGLDKIIWVFTNGTQYANDGLTDGNTYSFLIQISSFLKSVLFNNEYFAFSIILFISIYYEIKNVIISKLLKFDQLFFLLLFVVTMFTIFLPKNFFMHYNLFLLVPSTWFLSQYYNKLNQNNIKSYISIFIMTFILFTKFNIKETDVRLIYPYTNYLKQSRPIIEANEINKLLKLYSHQGDKLIIWGWGNNYFIENKLQRSSCFLYPQFAMENYKGRQQTIDCYIENIEIFKPKIIIQLVGEDRFFFTNIKTQSIEATSKRLFNLITENYNIIEKGNDYIFFLKK